MEAARPATASDLPRLAELARAALDELAPTRGGAVFVAREGRADPVADTLAVDLADPEAIVLAGTIDETVIGYATGRTEVLRDGSRLGTIHDLYVEEGARSVGVGEALMGELLIWFRAHGCAGVDTTALPGNRATKNFFEESGFTARLLVMHHRLA
ncbi:MAG: GNAT family N-acetyltransferase [Actinomycetota bacterium]|nr:GNAT family N-acetyltransferase [Actinomycetota bacterium]